MKKIYALTASLLFGVAGFSQHNVTFQVDLGSAAANANGVHVAGDFQGWDPAATALTQVGTTSVYEVTVSVPAGGIRYKFINGNTWTDVEGVPSESQLTAVIAGSDDNRWGMISSDTTLPAIMFGGNAPAGLNLMVAHVDLSLQTVAADGGKIAGDFNGWTDTDLADYDNDGTWETHIYLDPANGAQSFKYKNGASGWESVPSTCANGGGNREFANTGDAVMSACLNMCGPCVVLPTYDITVNVDLNSVMACTSIDSVTLAGDVNGWVGDLMSDTDGDGVYSILYTDVDSGEFKFKARYHYMSASNDTITAWEGGGNKVITVSSDSTVAARCFGNDTYGPCPLVPATADVTFIVDFTQASYTPADTIYLIGHFTQWEDNAIIMTPHTSAGQYITTVPSFCPGTMEYRFSNGDPEDSDNHEPVDSACGVDNGVGGYNRFFARTGSADTLRHTYGTCSFVGIEEGALDFVTLRPNPMTESTTIGLGSNDLYTVRVMDITGRVVAGFDNVQGDVELVRNNMVNGMYFVNVANSKGDVKTMKVVVE